MSNRRKQNRQTNTAINEMNESLKSIAQNAEQTSKNTGEIKSNTQRLVQIGQSKVPTIIGVATLIVTILGIIITNIAAGAIPTPTKEAYIIRLYPVHSPLEVNEKTDMIAVLNFDTSSVSITAYLNSIKKGDTLKMKYTDSTRWLKEVRFEETGIYEVIATATAPDGTIVEGSVEVEVY